MWGSPGEFMSTKEVYEKYVAEKKSRMKEHNKGQGGKKEKE